MPSFSKVLTTALFFAFLAFLLTSQQVEADMWSRLKKNIKNESKKVGKQVKKGVKKFVKAASEAKDRQDRENYRKDPHRHDPPGTLAKVQVHLGTPATTPTSPSPRFVRTFVR